MNHFKTFCQTEVPRLAEMMKAEGIKQGLTFERGYCIREETSGAMIEFPDVCGDADGNPIRQLVEDYVVAFHGVLTTEWRRTYPGMKAAMLKDFENLDKEDRAFLLESIIFDDEAETFCFRGDGKRAKALLAKLEAEDEAEPEASTGK
jgi:hypothetical protein